MGLQGKLDRVREMFRQTELPPQRPIGKPPIAVYKPLEREMTAGEQVKGWLSRFRDWWQL